MITRGPIGYRLDSMKVTDAKHISLIIREMRRTGRFGSLRKAVREQAGWVSRFT
jgi:hypothetical protein